MQNRDLAIASSIQVGYMTTRRLVLLAVFVLTFALASAAAQGRGMGRSVGMGSSVGVGHAVGSRGFGHTGFRGGIPSRGIPPGVSVNNFSRSVNGFGHQPGFRNHDHIRLRIGDPFFFRHSRFNRFNNGFFNNGFLFGGGYPYYGDPFFDSYSSGYGNSSQGYDREQMQVDSDIQNLRDEVRSLRDDQRDEHYAAQQYAESTRQEPARQENTNDGPATTLIFRDGHKLDSRNYAIAGTTLWIFNEKRAMKYPLSELDLDATKAANEPRGVEFSIPRR